MLGVFDGCGGLGAQRHRFYSDATEAFMASRLCSGAFYDAFEDTFSQSGNLSAEDFCRLAADYCALVLSAFRPHSEDGASIKGTMVRALPTTAAAVVIRAASKGFVLNPIWAGDSRVYLLMPSGLFQLTVDHTTVPDPMENLYKDGLLCNILCEGKKPHLHLRELHVAEPFLVFTATDGCFGYFSTPMEFEGVFLQTMHAAQSVAQWEEMLAEQIGAVAGDDYTLCMASYGFRSFQRMQQCFAHRFQFLQDHYLRMLRTLPLTDIEMRRELWQSYRADYLRYIKDET